MVVLSCELNNFASYQHLKFKFDSKGLVLIHGATGSGKSTLCDAIPWVLFGRTAKNGAVDDVLSWHNQKLPTQGTLHISHNETEYIITRIRGNKANDLYIQENHNIIRGKDLTDTQKIINSLLGINVELYLTAAYYHEFSSTAAFFTASAKNRRAILEQIVDLSLATKLQSALTAQRKEKKEIINHNEVEIKTHQNQLAFLQRKQKESLADFEATQAKDLELLEMDARAHQKVVKTLPSLKMQLASLNAKDVCEHCGASKNNEEYLNLTSKIRWAQDAEIALKRCLQSAKFIKSRTPPTSVLSEIDNTKEIIARQEKHLERERIALGDIEALEDIVGIYRSHTVESTIKNIEDKTNHFLTQYFDAEIKVAFSAKDEDKIEVEIFKDGNACSISQLSKGQRTLLKLCFGVSVMQTVATHQGLKFSQIFFDEALDGLDDVLKLKSLNMLWTLGLEYDTIYLVEHSSEIKAQIETKFEVKLENGNSVLYGA